MILPPVQSKRVLADPDSRSNRFDLVSYSHVSVWKWIQHYTPKKILQRKRRKEQEFIVDKTLLKVGNQYVWVCVAIEHFDKVILGIRISFERTMLVVEGFLKDFLRI